MAGRASLSSEAVLQPRLGAEKEEVCVHPLMG